MTYIIRNFILNNFRYSYKLTYMNQQLLKRNERNLFVQNEEINQ